MTATGGSLSVVPREVELKYRVRDADALRAWMGRGFGGALPDQGTLEGTEVVEDRYVDTVHGALARAGFGARLRRTGGAGQVVLTVKSVARDRGPAEPRSGSRSTALTRRVEVEGPASERLEPETWPSSPAQELVEELRGGGRLRTLFVIRQRREGRSLTIDEGHVLITLDDVTVMRGGRTVGTFCALEAEAADRVGAGLGRLAELFEASGLVDPEPRSKEEIAREMVAEAVTHREPRLPRVPKTPGVRADDTLATAGRKVLRMHLARMLASEEGTRSGADIEELHKMRVATRRMRAAWRVFEDGFRPRLMRRYVRELRGVAAALGEVRDLDVQVEGLAAWTATLTEEPDRLAIEPLRAAWGQRREAARVKLIALLDARQYQDFVEDYLDFVETPGAGERPGLTGEPVLVRDTAGSRILAAYERVRAYDTTMAWADVTTLHALRIEGKRLRYTIEYFAEVLPLSAAGLAASVTEMQDHLGLMNDAHVAATLVRDWLNSTASRLDPGSRRAVGLYLESREAEVQRLRRTFRPIWRRMNARTFRRSLGLAVAAIGG